MTRGTALASFTGTAARSTTEEGGVLRAKDCRWPIIESRIQGSGCLELAGVQELKKAKSNLAAPWLVIEMSALGMLKQPQANLSRLRMQIYGVDWIDFESRI